jgi:hypothetical protein
MLCKIQKSEILAYYNVCEVWPFNKWLQSIFFFRNFKLKEVPVRAVECKVTVCVNCINIFLITDIVKSVVHIYSSL